MSELVKPTIRPATTADLDQLAAFIEPFVEQGWLLRRTPEELVDLIQHGFVAAIEQQMVGFCALEIYSSKLGEIRSLAVNPLYRHLGVGRGLVEACLQRARDRNVLEVMAITSTEEFFLSCGFDFTLPGEKKALFYQTREKH